MKRLFAPLFRLLSIVAVLFSMNGLWVMTASAQTAIGERHYISDILLVPLRTGPTIQHRIINAGLRSGTEVVLLENDVEAQWSRIRAGEQEGWIPTRHLLDQPIARDQLNQLQAELDRVRQQYAALQQQSTGVEQEMTGTTTELAALRTERDEALRELDRISQLAGSELVLDRRNEELLAQNRTLQAENEQLLARNASLDRDTEQWRMIIGGVLVLIGIVVGLIFPGIARRRRNDGWN
jgi:SH3 domain protein